MNDRWWAKALGDRGLASQVAAPMHYEQSIVKPEEPPTSPKNAGRLDLDGDD